MNSTEITNLTATELELLFAQKELAMKYPETQIEEVAEVPSVENNFWMALDAGFDLTEILAIDEIKVALLNRIVDLNEAVAAEKEVARLAAVEVEIESLNALIAKEVVKIGNYKNTTAGRSFYNSRTFRTSFMTFTQINTSKSRNYIARLRNEIKDLKAA